jgi:hypothetical protein
VRPNWANGRLARKRARDRPRSRRRGRPGAMEAHAGALLVIALRSCSLGVRPSCTHLPVSSSNMVAPHAHKSLRASTSSQRPRACSGGMYAGVPSVAGSSRGLGRMVSRRQAPCLG